MYKTTKQLIAIYRNEISRVQCTMNNLRRFMNNGKIYSTDYYGLGITNCNYKDTGFRYSFTFHYITRHGEDSKQQTYKSIRRLLKDLKAYQKDCQQRLSANLLVRRLEENVGL